MASFYAKDILILFFIAFNAHWGVEGIVYGIHREMYDVGMGAMCNNSSLCAHFVGGHKFYHPIKLERPRESQDHAFKVYGVEIVLHFETFKYNVSLIWVQTHYNILLPIAHFVSAFRAMH